uniref:Cell division cycle protein 123 homolog n=1 Tax=Mesocestoides corti TaxID=53468 RepID=A0A5K3FJ20_MESCO
MKQEEVLACSFDSWYPIFEKYTTRSIIIDLPDEVLDYIKNAPLLLPKNSRPLKVEKPGCFDNLDEESWADDDDPEGPTFPDFESKVNKAISSLGGMAFPKLNWSAPKDAAWINFGSCLKCTSAADLLVLLKASDFISHDIYAPFALCDEASKSQEEPRLKVILRAWRLIRPETEFRCFIRSKRLYAICQRNYDSYFVFIEVHQENIKCLISEFFETVVKDKFPLNDYVMDVYIKNEFKSSMSVKLLDFNVFGLPTDGLLFEWTELNLFPIDKEIFFRWQTDKTMRSGVMSRYKLPIDLIDISSGKDPEKLIDLVQAHVDEQQMSVDDND